MVLEDADAQPKQTYVMQMTSMNNKPFPVYTVQGGCYVSQPRDCFIRQEWQCSHSIFFTECHVYFIITAITVIVIFTSV